MIRAAAFACALILAPLGALADVTISRLYDLLEIDAYLEITRTEGLDNADSLSFDMLGRAADAGLIQQLAKIYDLGRMQDTVRGYLSDMAPEDRDAVIVFFQSELGLAATELEVAARRAMMDAEIEQAARLAWVDGEETHPWLTARIDEMIKVNDLIERNVSGALNSNLRFYQGLADGDGLQLSESEMLNEVWGQADDIRADTTAWLGAYMLMSYQSLDESDVETYRDFWGTGPGRALNAAVFEAFNEIYDDVSYATGRVIALNMSAQDL